MTDQLTSGGASQGEGDAPPDEICTATRHDPTRAAYQAGCRCPRAVQANRDYHRTYEQLRAQREQDEWRRRKAAASRAWKRRILADPNRRQELNARRRRWAEQQRQAARYDATHLVDPVVVDRLVNGEPTHYNRAERREAVRRLRDRGLAYRQIAERLHIEDRQVHRDLTALGLVAVAS